MLSTAFSRRSPLPKDLTGVEKLLSTGSPDAMNDFAAAEEMRLNWPQFRGLGGAGLCSDTNVPLTWDVKTGTGVAWRSNVPVPGFNSPIVWGDRVFLSGADSAKREILCYGLARGELLGDTVIGRAAG